MKQKLAALGAVLAIVTTLTACSGEEPFDAEAVEATLATNPEVVVSGSQTELLTTYTGMEASAEVRVNYDIRIDGEPHQVKAYYQGDDGFSGVFTFPESGSYDVFIHTYVGNLHLTFKKTVEVQ